MRFIITVVLTLWGASAASTVQNIANDEACRVTVPNGNKGGDVEPGFFGSRELSVSLMPPTGTSCFQTRRRRNCFADGSCPLSSAGRGHSRCTHNRGASDRCGCAAIASAYPSWVWRHWLSGHGSDFSDTGMLGGHRSRWSSDGHVRDKVVKIGKGPGRP